MVSPVDHKYAAAGVDVNITLSEPQILVGPSAIITGLPELLSSTEICSLVSLTTNKSALPLPSISTDCIAVGFIPTLYILSKAKIVFIEIGGGKSPVVKRILTVPVETAPTKLFTAMSINPSPLKSPAVIPVGEVSCVA